MCRAYLLFFVSICLRERVDLLDLQQVQQETYFTGRRLSLFAGRGFHGDFDHTP